MFTRITDGRTDLVFDFIETGNPVNSHDSNGVNLIKWCAHHGDVRPAAVLKLLCYDNFNIHPDNHSDYDHGTGWGQMDLKGKIPG